MSDLSARRRLIEYQSDCWWLYGDKQWDEVLSSAEVAANAYIELSDPNVSDRFAYSETRRAFVMAVSRRFKAASSQRLSVVLCVMPRRLVGCVSRGIGLRSGF